MVAGARGRRRGRGDGRRVRGRPDSPADGGQLADLRSAAEPVYAVMRADQAQADMLARIEDWSPDSTAEPLAELPDGCAYQPGDENRPPPQSDPVTGPGRTGDLPRAAIASRGRWSSWSRRVPTWTRYRPTPASTRGPWPRGKWGYEQAPEVPEATEVRNQLRRLVRRPGGPRGLRHHYRDCRRHLCAVVLGRAVVSGREHVDLERRQHQRLRHGRVGADRLTLCAALSARLRVERRRFPVLSAGRRKSR